MRRLDLPLFMLPLAFSFWFYMIQAHELRHQIDILSASIDRAPLPPTGLADTLYFWDTGLVGVGCRLITPGSDIPDPLALQAALTGRWGVE